MLTSYDLLLARIRVLFSFFVSILSFDIFRLLKILIASTWVFSFTKLSKMGISSFFNPSFSNLFFMTSFFLFAICYYGFWVL